MLLKKLAIFMIACVLIVAFGMIQGCSESEKIVEPVLTDVGGDQNEGDSTLVDDRKDGQSAKAAGAATWPRRMSDFKFPFRYGETWKITCGYHCGYHTNKWYPHAGTYSVDLVRRYNQTAGSCVLAPARGVIIFSGWKRGYGWCVIMDHDRGHTGQGYKSIVAHLESDPRRFVHVGDDLLRGTILGYCGASGGNWGAHIHFSIWKHNRSVVINGISGYTNLVTSGSYRSYNWPVQPPHAYCSCARND